MQQLNKNFYKCPGKVLLAGGYAVVYDTNCGLSLGIDVYYYSSVNTEENNKDETNFRFISMQFGVDMTYSYENQTMKGPIDYPYLQAICQVIVEDEILCKLCLGKQITFTILCDPLFFCNQSKEFKFIGNLGDIPKSGLGSSSALIVSSLGSLLKEFKVEGRLMELSYKANHLAQKKIGSGFDIATSINGTQIYKRPNETSKGIPQMSTRITLSDKLKLLMVDLNRGQNTILNVSSVTAYLKHNPDKKNEFLEISENVVQKLIQFLQQLEVQNKEHINQIKQLSMNYRQCLKNLGIYSGCEIEPDISTFIINSVMEQFSEVIYGICPGAGGYDAIVFLVYGVDMLDIQHYKDFLSQTLQSSPFSQQKVDVYELGLDFNGFCQLDCESQKYKQIQQTIIL